MPKTVGRGNDLLSKAAKTVAERSEHASDRTIPRLQTADERVLTTRQSVEQTNSSFRCENSCNPGELKRLIPRAAEHGRKVMPGGSQKNCGERRHRKRRERERRLGGIPSDAERQKYVRAAEDRCRERAAHAPADSFACRNNAMRSVPHRIAEPITNEQRKCPARSGDSIGNDPDVVAKRIAENIRQRKHALARRAKNTVGGYRDARRDAHAVRERCQQRVKAVNNFRGNNCCNIRCARRRRCNGELHETADSGNETICSSIKRSGDERYIRESNPCQNGVKTIAEAGKRRDERIAEPKNDVSQ